jgi:Subtilase family
MPHDPSKPLLRLNQPNNAERRRSGGGGASPRRLDPAAQVQNHGPVFQNLQNVLAGPNAALQLRADPNSLAPERLLVFEVTGSVANFARAVARIPGLEFAGEEELAADALDESPEFYLLVPQVAALQEIVSLWSRWTLTGSVPRNYTPWRDLFLQLRAVRPWGPADRVTAFNRAYFEKIVHDVPDNEPIRIEIELVFRGSDAAATAAEADVVSRVVEKGGQIVHRSRRPEFAYHALLVDLPAVEIQRIANLDPASLAAADPVVSITPQSVGTPVEAGDRVPDDIARVAPTNADPIAAVFDAVPMQAHPLLAGHLSIDDPDNLEARAVGLRVHGTAMASLAVHGDLNDPATPISRRVYFRPVMFAPGFGDEVFDSGKLVIDVVVEAVMRMRQNGGTNVVVVNLSLGDRTKPFGGKISTWARALDYLAYTYGILFLVSAGNINDGVQLGEFADQGAYQAARVEDRERVIFRSLDAVKADRRLLAPADSVNALTIGSWHRDSSQEVFAGASPFPAFSNVEMPNLSSRLGLGLRRATKPEVLLAGGRQRVRFDPVAAPLVVVPHHLPSRYWGLKVAAPPENGVAGLHFTIGTSAATALATHSAHRIFDALEDAYPQLIGPMALTERAALLKAMLVHSATWRGSEAFIRPIVDPNLDLHHEHWRREVCRHLGYGFVDPEDAVTCAGDRATMWATGTLAPESSVTFDVPLPAAIAASATRREVRATLAWFTPVRPGHLAYRAVKLKIASLEDPALVALGVSTSSLQPSNSQSESGTVVHRRWQDTRIGNFAAGATFALQIQRERDQGTTIDEAIPFGLAVTLEMPGAATIYQEVHASITIKPRVRIPA